MTTLDRWFFGTVVYRSAVFLRGEGEVFKDLKSLRHLVRSDPARVDQWKAERLLELLHHAHSNSSWYRERLPGPPPTSARVLPGYLAKIAPLEKRDLRLHANKLLADKLPSKVTRKTTGGSTGETVTVVKDRRSIAREMAATWLAYSWFGVTIGDRAVRFWGVPFTRKRRLRFLAADLAMHRIRFSAFDFDQEDLNRYWNRCRRFDPDYLYGYVSMIVDLARFLEDSGMDGRVLGLKVVITTSEVLHESERELLENTFGCPVQNEYGCGEVGPIAYSCVEGNLHVMTSNVHLEVLRPDGSRAAHGESGELVVTDLGNHAMPLIRYRVGDYGILAGGRCSCGLPFPVLEQIWGRSYDFVESPSGRRYHGEFFMYLFEELRDLGFEFDRFQVRQVDVETIRVCIVTDRMNPKMVAELRGRIEQKIPGVRSDIVAVREIPRLPSGKTRIVVNEVSET